MKPMHLFEKRIQPSTLLVVIIGAMSCVIYFFTPFDADDLAYTGFFTGAHPQRPLSEYILWCGSHWLTTHGRLPILATPLLTNGPRWLLALVSGTAVALMYFMMIKAGKLRGGSLPFLMILAVALAYPWWDEQRLFVCVAVYIASLAIGLIAYTFITDDSRRSPWMLVAESAVCLIAGACHEAMSLPLLCGFGTYMLVMRWRPTRRQWILLAAFTLGLMFMLSSPGFLARSGGGSVQNDTTLWLLLKSDPAVLLLWAAIILFSLSAKGRSYLKPLLHSPLFILAVAAIPGAAICVYSGIVGRSGVFGEFFAIAALFGWAAMWVNPSCKWLNWIIAIALTAQYAGLAVIQKRLWDEGDEFTSKYVASGDGILFMDATHDQDLPWWTLGHLRGVPDADDFWSLYCQAKFYRHDFKWPVVMPLEAQAHYPVTADSLKLSNGDLLMNHLPDVPLDTLNVFLDVDVVYAAIDGRQWVVQPVEGGYFITPRLIDYGDR